MVPPRAARGPAQRGGQRRDQKNSQLRTVGNGGYGSGTPRRISHHPATAVTAEGRRRGRGGAGRSQEIGCSTPRQTGGGGVTQSGSSRSSGCVASTAPTAQVLAAVRGAAVNLPTGEAGLVSPGGGGGGRAGDDRSRQAHGGPPTANQASRDGHGLAQGQAARDGGAGIGRRPGGDNRRGCGARGGRKPPTKVVTWGVPRCRPPGTVPPPPLAVLRTGLHQLWQARGLVL